MAKTIGQLTQATTLASGDEFVIEQSGLTKRVAASVVRGGLVNADIDAAAAIALSKLATGALPTAITVATANIVDAAVTIAKLGTNEQKQIAKAWVNFNGTGTVSIRAEYNVSSITDNGAGNYTVNLTSAMSDANGCVVCGASFGTPTSDIADFSEAYITSTSAIQVICFNASAYQDAANMYVVLFR